MNASRMSFLFISLFSVFLITDPSSGIAQNTAVSGKYRFLDMHADTVTYLYDHPQTSTFEHSKGQLDLSRMEKGEMVKAVMIPIWFPTHIIQKRKTVEHAQEKLQLFKNILSTYAGRIEQARTADDVNGIINKGKIAILLSMEGAYPLEGKPELLDDFVRAGLRSLQITWNVTNRFGDAALGEKLHNGLTPEGYTLVKKAEEQKVIIDTSHMSYETFWDVIEISRQPVVATHSNVWALQQNERNLDDEQIKAIAEKNGVVGIAFHTDFLTDEARASMQNVVENIEYIATLVGIDHVAIGTDFDGHVNAPYDLEGVEDLPKLTEMLLDRGFAEGDIDKIYFSNFMRVLNDVDKYVSVSDARIPLKITNWRGKWIDSICLKNVFDHSRLTHCTYEVNQPKIAVIFDVHGSEIDSFGILMNSTCDGLTIDVEMSGAKDQVFAKQSYQVKPHSQMVYFDLPHHAKYDYPHDFSINFVLRDCVHQKGYAKPFAYISELVFYGNRGKASYNNHQ
jgi:membrane dipeptidase